MLVLTTSFATVRLPQDTSMRSSFDGALAEGIEDGSDESDSGEET